MKLRVVSMEATLMLMPARMAQQQPMVKQCSLHTRIRSSDTKAAIARGDRLATTNLFPGLTLRQLVGWTGRRLQSVLHVDDNAWLYWLAMRCHALSWGVLDRLQQTKLVLHWTFTKIRGFKWTAWLSVCFTIRNFILRFATKHFVLTHTPSKYTFRSFLRKD